MVGKTRFVAFCCRGSFNKFHCCQRVNKSHHHNVTQEAWLWSLMWTWFLHVFTKHETWWSHHDTLREKIAQVFIAELTRQSFAVVAVPVPMAAPVRGIFAAPETVLGHSGAAGPLVWSFKRQGELKDWNSVLAPLATVRSCYVLHQLYLMYIVYIVLIRLELFWYIHASRKVADVHWGVGCRWFKEIAFSQWMALGCPRRSFFSWSFSPLWWLLVRNAARSEGWAWPMQRTCSMQRIYCCPPFKSWFLGSINQECLSICWTTHSLMFPACRRALQLKSWVHGAHHRNCPWTSRKNVSEISPLHLLDPPARWGGRASHVSAVTDVDSRFMNVKSDQVPLSEASKQLGRIRGAGLTYKQNHEHILLLEYTYIYILYTCYNYYNM